MGHAVQKRQDRGGGVGIHDWVDVSEGPGQAVRFAGQHDQIEPFSWLGRPDEGLDTVDHLDPTTIVDLQPTVLQLLFSSRPDQKGHVGPRLRQATAKVPTDCTCSQE